jgi:apoptosis-inducing factor 3
MEMSMGTEQTKPAGLDLATGVPIDDLPDGQMLIGHVGNEPVVLARRGDEPFAIGARCSHYGGPLAEGLMVDDTVRCPWRHARFSLRTGQALHPPALSPVACWAVEQRDRKLFVAASAEKSQTSESAIVNVVDDDASMRGAERRDRDQGNTKHERCKPLR